MALEERKRKRPNVFYGQISQRWKRTHEDREEGESGIQSSFESTFGNRKEEDEGNDEGGDEEVEEVEDGEDIEEENKCDDWIRRSHSIISYHNRRVSQKSIVLAIIERIVERKREDSNLVLRNLFKEYEMPFQVRFTERRG